MEREAHADSCLQLLEAQDEPSDQNNDETCIETSNENIGDQSNEYEDADIIPDIKTEPFSENSVLENRPSDINLLKDDDSQDQLDSDATAATFATGVAEDGTGSEIKPRANPILKRERTMVSNSSKKTKTGSTEVRERSMPYFKTLKVGGKTFAVDAFCYGKIDNVDGYFLTHFHSDHYGGLGKRWDAGPIYCSPVTARLAQQELKVDPDFFVPIEVGVKTTVDGVPVVFMDANHCPGSVIILFDKYILHTGDFRASEEILDQVKSHTSKLDSIYLDTTYLDPKRTFPSQPSVISACAEYCLRLQNKPPARSFFTAVRPTRILVMVGSYTIGKERLAIQIAETLNSKIFMAGRKRKILTLLQDAKLDHLMDINDGLKCQVHLVGMNELSMAKLEQAWKFLQKHFTHLVAFVPTGWTYRPPKKDINQPFTADTIPVTTNGFIQVCRVPYSEHSSFPELEHFCTGLEVKKIIPTVSSRHSDILRQWEN